MIVKQKQGSTPTDRFGKAGDKAEKQMAFYLRREFKESKDVLVFNDLKIKREGETAQIDHLVLHRYGFFIIESKSTTGKIEVNARNEFARVYSTKREGMKSPIRQAEMQRDLLHKLLNDNAKVLRTKNDNTFRPDYFHVLVAIADHGEIARVDTDPPELMKADAVAVHINDQLEKRRNASGFKGAMRAVFGSREDSQESLGYVIRSFDEDEIRAIGKFLLAQDVSPKKQKSSVARPAAKVVKDDNVIVPASKPLNACRHCDSGNLKVVHGKFGYYFKCGDCDQNTTIDFTCRCGAKAKISKRGNRFTWKCECGNDDLFFENPE